MWAKKMGIGAVKEVGMAVKSVLEEPTAIYRGILRDADDDRGQTEGWLCYVGKPLARYDFESGEQIATPGRVLLVFVNIDRVYYQHRWEEEDPDEPGTPLDKTERFREKPL